MELETQKVLKEFKKNRGKRSADLQEQKPLDKFDTAAGEALEAAASHSARDLLRKVAERTSPKRLSIACFIPDEGDTTSFYRAMGPLAHMAKRNPHVELQIADIRNPGSWWVDMVRSDIVFVQRPGGPPQFEVIKQAKCASKKVWIDFDDDLLEVPMHNPAYDHYSIGQIKDLVQASVRAADLVTVSTLALANTVKQFLSPGAMCVVIPNAYDHDTFAWMRVDHTPREKVLVWRGSMTHDGDLHPYAAGIIAAMKKHPDWKFQAFGGKPWMILKELEPSTWASERHPMLIYHHRLFALRPAAVVVPLEDNRFNQCKSNIAYIEATMAGANTIAPAALAEFKRPGIYGMTHENCEEILCRWLAPTSGNGSPWIY